MDGLFLDPFEIGADWFEVELPSLRLKLRAVPKPRQAAALLTLERLDLAQGLRSLELRWEWYEEHRLGHLSLEGLWKYAPLVAKSVQEWQENGKGELRAIPRPVKDPYLNLI